MNNSKEPGNYIAGIHEDDYLYLYLCKQTGADNMIFEGIASGVSTGAVSRTGESARRRITLDGEWKFGVDQYDTCLRQRWFEENYTDGEGRPCPVDYDFDGWDEISVPSCWNLRDERHLGKDLYLYEGSCVCTRTFSFNALPAGERVFLRFGAANSTCYVFLNKQYLGVHTGGHTPFYFEVTSLLGEHNRLIAVVNNTRRRGGVPAGNTDWFNYGGLYRSVSLLCVPQTFIRGFFIALVPDGTYRNIKVSLSADGPDNITEAVLEIKALGICETISLQDGSGSMLLTLPEIPRLWSPDDPYLYDVTVTCGDDEITERIGLREIKAEDGCIFLNGREIFLKGVCAHEESVINGNAVTDAEIRENFALAREMGCNFMRLAHYPHTEAAARIADETGIMLWEEIPVYWAIDFESEKTYESAENQLAELIMRDRNRASVIIWSVGNENADTDARLSFMKRLAHKARALDGTRLVSAACLVDGAALMIRDRLAEHLDVIGINEYYGWYVPDFSQLPRIFENSLPSKPVVITEFGADAKAGLTGAEGELYTEENQRAVYEKQLAVLGSIPYIKGICPWIFYDFRCPRRLHPLQNYYNIKGLLSADKKHRKPAFDVMKRFYLLPRASFPLK